MTTRKEWTLAGLVQAMNTDIESCTAQLERSMCRTICKKEIRAMASELRKTRKLTPGEESILLNC